MEITPNFVVFEGGDGSGTTTQLSLLGERLKHREKPAVFFTFEPTDQPIGLIIRKILKKELTVTPQTLAMLYAADRNEHTYGSNGILEHINRDYLVVSDRYVMSSLVYQGIECGFELPYSLNSRFPAPQVMIFFDIEPEIALNRMKVRNSQEIYDYQEFQAKVRTQYLSLMDIYRKIGVRVEIIDASKNEQEVADEVWSIISRMPIFN